MTTTEHEPTPTGPIGADLVTVARYRAGQRDALEAQVERYRNIITALEAELAETTDKLTEAEHLAVSLRDEFVRTRAGWEREGRRAEDIARRNAELRAEADALRAQVAELTRLNTEGRPWQITRAETGA